MGRMPRHKPHAKKGALGGIYGKTHYQCKKNITKSDWVLSTIHCLHFLKKILPKRLFYRALLIVAVPVLVLQLIITFVFFDSLWIKTNKGMTRALINEINTFVEVYDNEKIDKEELKNLFYRLQILVPLYYSLSKSIVSSVTSFDGSMLITILTFTL